MNSKLSVLSAASAMLLTLALAGCGSGSDEAQASSSGSGESSGGSSNNPQGGSSPDAFITRVMAVIGNTSETAEPEVIGSVTVTNPENAEPVPVS